MTNLEQFYRVAQAYLNARHGKAAIERKRAELRDLERRVESDARLYQQYIAANPRMQEAVERQIDMLVETGVIDPAERAPTQDTNLMITPAPTSSPLGLRPARKLRPRAPRRVASTAQATGAETTEASRQAQSTKPGAARTAAATAASARKRAERRAMNVKLPRTLESRIELFDAGFFEGYEATRFDPTAVNPHQKGDRARGWAIGRDKALEDVAAGTAPDPTPPELIRTSYAQELSDKGAPLAAGRVDHTTK